VFLFSRQLDTQCAIFGTNGTPANIRSASRTRWNYHSFACSVTGNDRQPHTYLQVDILLLFVLPSKLGPKIRVDDAYVCVYACKNATQSTIGRVMAASSVLTIRTVPGTGSPPSRDRGFPDAPPIFIYTHTYNRESCFYPHRYAPITALSSRVTRF
jgi:hypothetical protein